MNIQALLNLGISVAHKRAFPKTIPIKWPILTKKKPNEWLDLLLVKDVFFINQNWRNKCGKVSHDNVTHHSHIIGYHRSCHMIGHMISVGKIMHRLYSSCISSI